MEYGLGQMHADNFGTLTRGNKCLWKYLKNISEVFRNVRNISKYFKIFRSTVKYLQVLRSSKKNSDLVNLVIFIVITFRPI